MELTEQMLEGVAFAGETLGPFYLQDPQKGTAGAAYQAIAELDASAAAAEWPFAGETAAKEALELMQQGLAAGCTDDALVWEYRRLLIGPGEKPAPPWGSVYTDREQVVFGESTLALRQWMREVGILRVTDERTPEDHIGLMLLMMAWIARNKPAELADFLQLHLLPWSSHFLGEFADAAQQPFFRGLALLTRETLEGLQHALGLKVAYPKFYR